MNTFTIIVIITSALNLFLGYFIFSRGAKNAATYSLFLFAFVSGVWGVFLYYYTHPVLFSSLVWIKIVYLMVFFLIGTSFYFSFVFPTKSKSPALPLVLYGFLAIPLVWLLFFTNLWIKEVVYQSGKYTTVLGFGYNYFGLYIGIFTTWLYLNLISKYRKSSGIVKTQIMYVLLGLFLFGGLVITVDVIIPVTTGNTQFFSLSPLCSLFFVVFTAYAITRYRLMDVRLVIGRGVVYFLSLSSVILLSFFLIFLNNKLTTPFSINIVGPLAMIIGIFLFQSLFRFFERLASKFFYYTFYSYQAIIADLGKKLTRVLDLNNLSYLVVNTLMATMKLDRTVILLREPGNGDYRIQKNIGFREENGISLVKDNFLTLWLERTQSPLVYEELSLIIRDTQNQKEKLEKLRVNMKRIEAVVCLPLLIEKKIIGMIILGNKASGESYSTQDINLLTTLANQVSISLQNAKLYDEIKGFNAKLEKEVAKRTRELKEAYEDLKKLDKAKSEFISIASHQLRTPLSIIKGYVSMMLEGIYGALPLKMEKVLKNINVSNERLIKLINDLLDISRIESGKMEMNPKKTSLTEMISSVINELKIRSEKKHIYLKYDEPTKELPQILLDQDKIRQAILNVIDNAIRYTNRGGVTVKLEIENCKLKIVITDTGEGMTQEEVASLFESFSRGTAGVRLSTEGVGLGLYTAKKFIEMDQGRVWAESEGKNKGSTFYIELPIK